MDPNIVIHPTWNIIDSSKIQDYMMCPRYYFYQYMLGWRPEEPNHDLIFGEAWHASMLWLNLHGYSDENIILAFDKFLEVYRPIFPEESDELYSPKTPINVLKMLGKYCVDYASDRKDFEVLYGEVGGTVSIDKDRMIAFRQDTICRGDNGIFSLEHKTTKKSFTRTWFDQWRMKMQVGTYSHVIHCLFPGEMIEGVKINGASFMNTKLELDRRTIDTQLGYMQQWLWNVLRWVDQIYWEMEKLDSCTEADPILFCFPLNTESCTKYWGCRYIDFCYTWNNPLQHCHVPPVGMKCEYWNPLEMKVTTKVVDGQLVK